MKKIIIIFITLFAVNLFAIHNFTIDGEENIEVSVGDEVNVYFEYEEIGSSATITIEISMANISLPAYESGEAFLEDGGTFDSTPVDGIFSANLPIFASAPEGAIVTIILTDNEISDQVELSFIQIDSDFSLSGTITQENSWMDLPLPGALVYTIYNAGIEQLSSLLAAGDTDQLLEFFLSGHYLLSDVTMLLGTYQIFVPDEIPNVTCTTGVTSMLNAENTHVAPPIREDIIDGHIANINFYYAFADGIITATIIDEYAFPIQNAIATISTEEQTIPTVFTSDENGQFSAGMANGDYNISISAIGYELYTSEFTISDTDLELTIEMIPLLNAQEEEISAISYNLSNYPNPFYNSQIKHATSTKIKFSILENSKNAEIVIFNTKGQKINSLTAILQGEEGSVIWNGTDYKNRSLSAGIYLYNLILDGRIVSSSKLLLLK